MGGLLVSGYFRGIEAVEAPTYDPPVATRLIPGAKTLPKSGTSPKTAASRRKVALKSLPPAEQAVFETVVGTRAVAQLARPVTAMFFAVPLLAAVLGAGEVSRLATLSGATALFLAVDVLLERIGHPTRPARGVAVAMIAWLAGLALLGNAGQTAFHGYHGEAATLVGVTAAAFVATTCSRSTAILWSLSAAAAVGLGASLAGAPTPGMVMAVCSIGFGVVIGLLLGSTLDTPIVGTAERTDLNR